MGGVMDTTADQATKVEMVGTILTRLGSNIWVLNPSPAPQCLLE